MEFRLRCQNIIVVGGGTGIGYSITQKLLDYGAKNVIIASRNLTKLQEVSKKFRHNENQTLHCMQFDITDISSQNDFLHSVTTMIGEIPDGLVISSGINFDGSNWKGFNISESDWDAVMDTNLKGVFFLIRNFANYLNGNAIKGNINVVSSISAHRDLLSPYQVAKNAISGIVHAYGKHLCERGIILNCVEPGTTDGGMLKNLGQYADGVRDGKAWSDNSIRRVIRPEEIADIVCFMLSDLGEVMSGTCLLAGGGCKGLSR